MKYSIELKKLNKPDFDKLLEFWKIIRPIEKKEYVEIRFTDGGKPQEYYDKVKLFQELHPDIIVKKGAQFFIQKFSQLTLILSFDEYYFFHNYKICYGLSLRIKNKAGELGGGYDFVKSARFVFFDIDKKDHSNIFNHEIKSLHNFIETIVTKHLRPTLECYTLISSGGGMHLLYKINETRITDSRRMWFRQFVKQQSAKINNYSPYFAIDGLYDFTRVFALPETMNVKRNIKVRSVILTNQVNGFFKIRSLQVKKSNVNLENSKYKLPELKDSLEWYVLLKGAPEGERHQSLVFALKLFLKAKGVTDVKEYEQILNSIYGGNVNLDPSYGTNDKEYHPGIVINWCKRNKKWCKANNIEYEGYANVLK